MIDGGVKGDDRVKNNTLILNKHIEDNDCAVKRERHRMESLFKYIEFAVSLGSGLLLAWRDLSANWKRCPL